MVENTPLHSVNFGSDNNNFENLYIHLYD